MQYEKEPDLRWKISGMKEKLKVSSFALKSKPFFWTKGYPLISRLQLEMDAESDGLYAWLSVEDDHNAFEESVLVKVFPKISILLKNQSINENHPHVITSFNCSFNSNFSDFLSQKRRVVLRSFLTHPSFNVDDAILVEVNVEPPKKARQVSATDGYSQGVLKNFRERKELEEGGFLEFQESPYFYTGKGGYRVRVKLFLAGFGEHRGKGLTVGVCFLTGEFDGDLPASFPHKTNVILRDRKQALRSIVVTVKQNIVGNEEYLIDVCSERQMERLVDDDALYCDVEIIPKKAKKIVNHPTITFVD